MNNALKAHIEYLLCTKINTVRSISGGDISKAYLIETETERFFCKVNRSKFAYAMFEAEKCGLLAISETKTIAVPTVLLSEPLENGAFVVMEYIEAVKPFAKQMGTLGHQLAALHQFSSSKTFGWASDNFIGSLPQSNTSHSDWPEFFVKQRLLPQLKLARDKNLLHHKEIPSEEQLLKTCQGLFPTIQPSLLHGDLWAGNYLISQTGKPYLIDPATHYGHHEVDMAMTHLFGGFDESFYSAYHEHFTPLGGEKQRRDIYQLYYLLVHLNLFGRSYRYRVESLLKAYF